MADNIILIGFMGVGKGRTARALAALTGRFAVDTDDLIESMVKMKIRDIFATQGEAEFRRLEQCCADWLERQVSGTVVSAGGGFFKVSNLKRLGQVVYLHSDLAGILEAMRSHPNAEQKMQKRPLLQDLAKAEALFNERLPQYRQAADVEIAVRGRGNADIAAEIAARLRA
ncbi:MAG: shikimate kinase [Candidatus Electronema sp. V4]|uniref:shikimate kinase n=1 Tax=Candidatus Electronema sp. V4 TaxID=3454756 RepID=UPI004055811D